MEMALYRKILGKKMQKGFKPMIFPLRVTAIALVYMFLALYYSLVNII